MRPLVPVLVLVAAGCFGGPSGDGDCNGVEVVPPANSEPGTAGEFFPVAPGEPFTLVAQGFCGDDPDSVTWHTQSSVPDVGFPVRNETVQGPSREFDLFPIGMYRVSATPVFGAFVGADGWHEVGVTPVVGLYETHDADPSQGVSVAFQAFCCPGLTGIRLIDGGFLPWQVSLVDGHGTQVWSEVVSSGAIAGIGDDPYQAALGERFLESFTLSVVPQVVGPPGGNARVEFCVGHTINPGQSDALDMCPFDLPVFG